MKKFLVTYHSPAEAEEKMKDATPEDQEKGMKVWMDWKESMGDKLVDFGAPLSNGTVVSKNSDSEKSTKEISGYSIVQAEDMDAAKAMFKNHPHLSYADSCSIEVHECTEM